MNLRQHQLTKNHVVASISCRAEDNGSPSLLRQKSSVLHKLRDMQSMHCRRVHSWWQPVSMGLLGEEQTQRQSH